MTHVKCQHLPAAPVVLAGLPPVIPCAFPRVPFVLYIGLGGRRGKICSKFPFQSFARHSARRKCQLYDNRRHY